MCGGDKFELLKQWASFQRLHFEQNNNNNNNHSSYKDPSTIS